MEGKEKAGILIKGRSSLERLSVKNYIR